MVAVLVGDVVGTVVPKTRSTHLGMIMLQNYVELKTADVLS